MCLCRLCLVFCILITCKRTMNVVCSSCVCLYDDKAAVFTAEILRQRMRTHSYDYTPSRAHTHEHTHTLVRTNCQTRALDARPHARAHTNLVTLSLVGTRVAGILSSICVSKDSYMCDLVVLSVQPCVVAAVRFTMSVLECHVRCTSL